MYRFTVLGYLIAPLNSLYSRLLDAALPVLPSAGLLSLASIHCPHEFDW